MRARESDSGVDGTAHSKKFLRHYETVSGVQDKLLQIELWWAATV